MKRRPTPGNAKLLKELNQYLVLDALRRLGSMSRTELARTTGLTAPTVGVIVKGLLDDGFLLERDTQPGRMVGRRAVPLELNPRAGVSVGINIGVTHATILVLDFQGQVQVRARLPVPPRVTPEDMVRSLAAKTRELLAEVRPRRVFGVGVGLHGPVDYQSGTLLFAPHFGWRDVPFARMLSEDLSMPVIADNGVRCMALGELWFGAGKGVQNFVCLAVGTGIGAAIVLDGRLYRGVRGTAGEIGHVTVDVEGPLCHCGSYGCLETLSSGPALARRAAKLIKQGNPSELVEMVPDVEMLTAEMVARAATDGDAVAQQAFQEAGTYLGVAIANLVKTLNPELILVGGGVAASGDLLLEPIRRVLAGRALYQDDAALPVRTIALGADAGAIGAATLVLERVFSGEGLEAVLEILER